MPPDVVYPIRPGGADDPASLRYSLRTLHHHFAHGRVFIVGHLPGWVDPKAVTHIQTKQRRENTAKFSNMKLQLRAILGSEVSEEFVMMNDDFFFLSDIDSIPLHHKGSLADHLENCAGPYREGLTRCLSLLQSWGFDNALNTAVHVPMPIKKSRLTEVMERAWAGVTKMASTALSTGRGWMPCIWMTPS